MNYHIIVPAAGNGQRFGEALPKQYSLLLGKPVLQHSIERMRSSFPGSGLYVAIAPDDLWFDRLIIGQDDVRVLRCCGPSREATVGNAIGALPDTPNDDWIVVHDAVRPCIDSASVLRLKSELQIDTVGVLLAIPVADSLKLATDDGHVVSTTSRDQLWRAQTPQMFRCGILCQAFAQHGASAWTDEAHGVELLGQRPRIVTGSVFNLKITVPDDLALAAAIMSLQATPVM